MVTQQLCKKEELPIHISSLPHHYAGHSAHKKEDQSMPDHDPDMLHHTCIAPPA